jgi:hypothetical protein
MDKKKMIKKKFINKKMNKKNSKTQAKILIKKILIITINKKPTEQIYIQRMG